MGFPCLRYFVRTTSLTFFIFTVVLLVLLNLRWCLLRYCQHSLQRPLSRDTDSQKELLLDQNKTYHMTSEDFNTQQSRPQSVLDRSLEREMKRRREILDSTCKRLHFKRKAKHYTASFFDNVLVLDPYKLLFSFIPKVSSSSWKQVLGDLMVRANASKLFTTLDKYSTEERDMRLETYKKAVFVREPINRLLSAWMSKFRDDPKDQERWEKYFGQKIVKRYRKSPPQSSKWLNITFMEFAQFVTDYGPSCEIDTITNHFVPQNEICHPCHINYQFIGHFENLVVEGPYFLRWISADHLVSFPRFQPSAAGRSLKDELAVLPLRILDGLSKLYKRDYEMFGYSVEKTLDHAVSK
ncbi:carbohydrate sulfotransferase 11-like [Acanthaster planci]|uniref:Carbohydrate sulfotransferase n=1 Tax=Acanthaster planci TaxID=133434 RepID=A0A8B7YHZ5_ACAPL|nr:carbohydrate sulfotransferase 11-like [Acanthaster planci]